MRNDPNLIITQIDFEKLSALVASVDSDMADPLAEELGRASVVMPDQLPADVVSMNSQVSFVDLDTNKESTLTLVYPHEANIADNRVSILAPVGSALIGLKVGQVINWPLPQGKERRLKVVSVVHPDDVASKNNP